MRRVGYLVVAVLFLLAFVAQVHGGTSLVINSAAFDVDDGSMTLYGANFESFGELEVWIGDNCLTCSTLANCKSTPETIGCNLSGTPPASQGGSWIVRVSACNAPHCEAEIHFFILTGGVGCNSGDFVECYTDDPGTSGVGVCASGIRSCFDGDWGDCVGEVTPILEVDFCLDGLDNDCDGFVDCDDSDCALIPDCSLIDDDGDGWDSLVDCDDSNGTIYPGAPEVIGDGVDQDCDDADSCYQDLDGDSYGTAVLIVDDNLECDDDSTPDTSSSTGDCYDYDSDIFPGNPETCDGKDNDCANGPDDAWDFASDPFNCGGCNIFCSAGGAHNECIDGTCEFTCLYGLADCIVNSQAPGCETPILSDPFNCGGCGVLCPTFNCVDGVCIGD